MKSIEKKNQIQIDFKWNFSFLESRGRNPDNRSNKKSILKRSNEGQASSASSSSAAIGAEGEGDEGEEIENLIDCSGLSEPLSLITMTQQQHSRSSCNEISQRQTTTTSPPDAVNTTGGDWPYADDDPTESSSSLPPKPPTAS